MAAFLEVFGAVVGRVDGGGVDGRDVPVLGYRSTVKLREEGVGGKSGGDR